MQKYKLKLVKVTPDDLQLGDIVEVQYDGNLHTQTGYVTNLHYFNGELVEFNVDKNTYSVNEYSYLTKVKVEFENENKG